MSKTGSAEHMAELQALHNAEEQMWNENYGVEGWRLRNIPKVPHEAWDELIGIIGEDNIKICSLTTSNDWRRGYLLISPAGIERAAEYKASQAEEG